MRVSLLYPVLCATALAVSAGAFAAAPVIRKADVDAALAAAHAQYRTLQEGKNADYIPALAKVPSNLFGIVVIDVNGNVSKVGDVDYEFAIESISKVFTLARVLQDGGEAAIENGMGVDATGRVFNSVNAIEQHQGREMNPFVNPGAIAATSMVKGATPETIWAAILGMHNDFAGRSLSVNEEVYKSEAATNQHNQAIAMLMYSYGVIKSDPLQANDIYTRQCSINVNATDLATMAASIPSRASRSSISVTSNPFSR